MIQVCSTCGTRWNVRDRRRVWCPRCQRHAARPFGACARSRVEHSSVGLARGTGWAAGFRGCRPAIDGSRCGPVRPRRHAAAGMRSARRRVMRAIPRWGLEDHFDAPELQAAAPRSGPSLAMVRATLIATMVALGFAAFVHLVRYALLIVNRSMLLNKMVAFAATWLGVARQCGRAVHGRRQRGGDDELAHRTSGRGVRAPRPRRSTPVLGAARGLPCAVCEFGRGRRCS